MRKIFAILMLLCAFTITAQYYNPYNNPYANQQAFDNGRRMAEQMQQQQYAQDARSVTGCLNRIGKAIARRDFVEAEEWAERLLDLRKDQGYYYLGLVNELDGNGSYAKSCYQKGANNRSKACQKELERISNYGYATDEQIDNVVSYFQQLEVMSYNMAAQISKDIWGNSSSNYSHYDNSPNRSRATQKANCTKCHGTGYDPTPYNYSANADSHLNRAGNKCQYCGRTTKHYHYRCRH